MASHLSDLLCTNCKAAGLDLQSESSAVCRYCGTVNAVAGIVCPYCEFVNTQDAQTCGDCHQSLYRKCPNCGTLNWAGAEACIRCQSPLDVVASLGARYHADTAARLRAQQHDAASLKAKEAVDSDRRMAELNAIEQRRLQMINNGASARDTQQRRWITVLIVLGLIVVIAAVIFLAFIANH